MLLFIAQEFAGFFGGAVITQRNLSLCREALGEAQVKTYLLPTRKGGMQTLKEFATGYLMGLTSQHLDAILKQLEDDSTIRYVFIDYSLLGKLVKSIKQKFPSIKVLVFFHNVEIVYFSSYLLSSRKIHHAIGLPATIINEKRSIEYADTILTLNKRDSDDLRYWYKRSSDLIVPTSFHDLFNNNLVQKRQSSDAIILLFVGSRFFPNEEGMNWFIHNVMPFVLNAKLYIVGKGFEDLKNTWNSEKIEVVGTCQDLAPYYYMSDIVVAPIFTGSGMKTKVAEALMYGKTVLGTTEAFEGYEIDRNTVGKECKSQQDFIDYINNFKTNSAVKFNERSRQIYDELYNTNTLSQQFRQYLRAM